MAFLKYLFPGISKKHKFVAVSLALLIIAGLLLTLFFRYNFIVVEGVIVKNDPWYEVYNVERLDLVGLNVTSNINNHWLCTSECRYTFYDASNGEVISQEYFNVSGSRKIEFEKDLLVNKSGSGQLIYNYEVSCRNKQTRTCQASNIPKTDSTVFSVNYGPNEEDLVFRNETKGYLNSYLEGLNEAINSYFFLEEVLELEGVDFSAEKNLSDTHREDLDVVEEEFSVVNENWMRGDLDFFKDWSFEESVFERMNDLVLSVEESVNFYNRVVDSLSRKEYDFMLGFGFVSVNESDFEDSFDSVKNELAKETDLELLSIFYRDYDFLKEEIKEDFKQNFDYDLIYKSYLINQSSCPSCDFNLDFTLEEASDYLNLTNYLCSSVYFENVSYEDNETQVLKARASKIIDYLEYFNNSIAALDDKAYVKGELAKHNLTFEDYENYTFTENYRLYEQSYYEEINDLNKKCDYLRETKDHNISKINLEGIERNETVFYELNETASYCCAYGTCQICRYDSKNPVIFLHGHSVSLSSETEYSSNSFNNMMDELVKEEAYLKGYLIQPIREQEYRVRGELGKALKPFMFKATYYYTTYFDGLGYATSISMSENIDTYAIRLKEIIDYVKYTTNSDSVDIVSHSMGGLVSRRYLQIFGEENVDNLIMIGTPNEGITNRIYNACSLIGDNKECRDMRINSTFLRGLNDPNYEPKNTAYYTITGRGCEMREGEGDGIVLARNVPLSYADNYEVEGSCEERMLHSDLLNPSSYPEVYELVKEILIS